MSSVSRGTYHYTAYYQLTMAEQRNDIDLAVVQQHNARNDCWIVLHGKVYDVTAFLPEHPGGEEVVANLAGNSSLPAAPLFSQPRVVAVHKRLQVVIYLFIIGQDATDAFEEVGHSMQARNDALLYEIGTLKGAEKALGAFGDKAYNKHTFIASPLQVTT